MVANKYAFLQITRRRFLNEWEAFKKVISRRNIRRRITIPLTLSNLKLLRRITRTENILHRNFTRRPVSIQNRVASNIGISQSTFSVKVLNLFSRSRRKTNKRKSKHRAMLRNKATRHRMFIDLLNTTRKMAKRRFVSSNNIMVTLHEVITFLVSMQISISSLQTHNVNRCGRSRHLARKLSLRRKRSSPNVFEMAATETITSIILIKLIRVSLGTVRHPRRFKIVVIDIQITLKQMLRDFIGIRVNRAKKSGMVNITSSVNSRERSGINTILHELNPLFTINVTMRDIKSKNVYSRVNSKATTQWRKTESANGVHLEGVASDNRSS